MKTKFDNIAYNITEKRNPVPEDSRLYVGLEHLDSGSLYVTRYGLDVDLNGSKLVMHKGDVLLGKRNAYLRRAAIAPHDGLFSAHGMILRPKEVIDKNYFPFFVASDKFFDEVIRISVGGLSPTVNWKDLKQLEFDLPSLPEQQILANKLWAAYRLKESYKKLLAATDEMVKSQFIEMFGTIDEPKNCSKMTVAEAVSMNIIEKPLDGNHGGKHPKASEYVECGIPFIMANNFNVDGVDLDNCFFLTKERALRLDKGFAKHGDVLITHKGTIGKTAILHCPQYEFIMLTPQVTYYRPKKSITAEYLKSYFDSAPFQAEINNIASSGSTRAYIGIVEQQKLHLLVPDMKEQQKFVSIVQQADKSKFELRKSIEAIDNVIKSLINN